MEIALIRLESHQLLCARGLGLLVAFEGSLKLCLAGLLLRQQLGVARTLLRGVRHHLLVITLRVLLRHFRLLHLLIKVFDDEINHVDDSRAVRLFVGFWRWWWCFWLLSVSSHLDKRCRCVEFRLVELQQAASGKTKDLLGCRVTGHELNIISVLRFALRCCLCDTFVERFDTRLDCIDLTAHCCDAFLRVCNAGLQVGKVLFGGLDFVLRLVKLSRTVLLLAIVITLFSLECYHHLINHCNNLLETNIFSAKSQHDEIKLWAVHIKGAALLELSESLCLHHRVGDLHLHQAGTCCW
mmetsp:Transcript_26365/g.47844  ORF Transcript_26365/g.47844 Transcript_26365/m.47844 type:complete len:297 (-) Transcript_26365:628-1518(-)